MRLSFSGAWLSLSPRRPSSQALLPQPPLGRTSDLPAVRSQFLSPQIACPASSRSQPPLVSCPTTLDPRAIIPFPPSQSFPRPERARSALASSEELQAWRRRLDSARRLSRSSARAAKPFNSFSRLRIQLSPLLTAMNHEVFRFRAKSFSSPDLGAKRERLQALLLPSLSDEVKFSPPWLSCCFAVNLRSSQSLSC